MSFDFPFVRLFGNFVITLIYRYHYNNSLNIDYGDWFLVVLLYLFMISNAKKNTKKRKKKVSRLCSIIMFMIIIKLCTH